MKPSENPYFWHRYPIDFISHPVWLNFRSLNMGELLAHGVIATQETVRRWCLKFEWLCDRFFSACNVDSFDQKQLDGEKTANIAYLFVVTQRVD